MKGLVLYNLSVLLMNLKFHSTNTCYRINKTICFTLLFAQPITNLTQSLENATAMWLLAAALGNTETNEYVNTLFGSAYTNQQTIKMLLNRCVHQWGERGEGY
jgi:hypothetical protein